MSENCSRACGVIIELYFEGASVLDEKLLLRILRGGSDANIRFDDLCALLKNLGFAERIRGSHHIFTRDGVAEILNLQPKGSQAKTYQVKQVRNVILKYKLAGDK